MSAKSKKGRVSMHGIAGLLGTDSGREPGCVAPPPELPDESKRKSGKLQRKQVIVRLGEHLRSQLERKLEREGRTAQGYLEYLIRRDLEESGYL